MLIANGPGDGLFSKVKDDFLELLSLWALWSDNDDSTVSLEVNLGAGTDL
jgi:hypothetical protein